jgi:hypothetical protein
MEMGKRSPEIIVSMRLRLDQNSNQPDLDEFIVQFDW